MDLAILRHYDEANVFLFLMEPRDPLRTTLSLLQLVSDDLADSNYVHTFLKAKEDIHMTPPPSKPFAFLHFTLQCRRRGTMACLWRADVCARQLLQQMSLAIADIAGGLVAEATTG
jgi:hypothetical protein